MSFLFWNFFRNKLLKNKLENRIKQQIRNRKGKLSWIAKQNSSDSITKQYNE